MLELVLEYRQEGPILLDKMLKVKRVCEISGQTDEGGLSICGTQERTVKWFGWG